MQEQQQQKRQELECLERKGSIEGVRPELTYH